MYKYFKRFLDIVFSFTLILTLLMPMIFISIFLIIFDGFPIIFKAHRVGQYGKTFVLYKFRSMRVNAPKDLAPMYLDSKMFITPFGKFIRRFSIDEIPQLFNILNGSMSFIGPRPSGLSEIELISLRKEKGILNIKPGLTGLAQVNGRDILAQNIENKVKFDLDYLRNFSFMLDFKILFLTFIIVLFGFGYKEGK